MPQVKPKTKAGKQAAVKQTMHEFKHGTLRRGTGKPGQKAGKVKSRKQAIAIAMHESGQSKKRAKRLEGKAL